MRCAETQSQQSHSRQGIAQEEMKNTDQTNLHSEQRLHVATVVLLVHWHHESARGAKDSVELDANRST